AAHAMRHSCTGTAHLLLGLVHENSGVAAGILVDLRADADRIRGEIVGMLAGAPGGRVPGLVSMPTFVGPPHPFPLKPGRLLSPVALLVTGWLLFALAL